jgi:hypothetical protein
MFSQKVSKTVHERSAVLNGKEYAYTIIQTSAARTVRLRVSMNKGLEITVPRRFRLDHVDEIFSEHERWILKQLDKIEQRKLLREQHQLRDGSALQVLGEPQKIKIVQSQKPAVKKVQRLLFLDDRAVVDGHELHVHCDGTVKHAKETLEPYLRVIAEKYFATRVRELAEQMGLQFKKITIRGQKTRWGSCTREKNLSFNWRLVLLPVEVAESVIIHELAHTVHMNHSRAFYGFVERFCPEYRKLQKHLRNPQFPV